MIKSIHFTDDTTHYLDINNSTDHTSLISFSPNVGKCKQTFPDCTKKTTC